MLSFVQLSDILAKVEDKLKQTEVALENKVTPTGLF